MRTFIHAEGSIERSYHFDTVQKLLKWISTEPSCDTQTPVLGICP